MSKMDFLVFDYRVATRFKLEIKINPHWPIQLFYQLFNNNAIFGFGFWILLHIFCFADSDSGFQF